VTILLQDKDNADTLCATDKLVFFAFAVDRKNSPLLGRLTQLHLCSPILEETVSKSLPCHKVGDIGCGNEEEK
jgi:hypothetical protein